MIIDGHTADTLKAMGYNPLVDFVLYPDRMEWFSASPRPSDAEITAARNAAIRDHWINDIGAAAKAYTNGIVQWYPDGERDSWTVLAAEADQYVTERDDPLHLTPATVGPYMQAEIDATTARGVPMDADTLSSRVQANSAANQAALAAMKGARTAAIAEAEAAYAGTLQINGQPVTFADYVATYTSAQRFEAHL